MFKNNLKFTRAASWINSKNLATEKTAPHSWHSFVVTIFSHFLCCTYWRFLILRTSTSWSPLKSDGCQSILYIMLKNYCFFIIFTTSFVGSILLTNRPCYYHLFQFMQHDHFWYLNRVIVTHGKYLQFRVNALSYCFPVIKWYTFHYLIKSDQFQENRPLLKYCNCLIHGVIKD